MNYRLEEFHRNISDSDLLDDLKKVAANLATSKLSSRQYNDNGGKYTAGTISARFGSWNNALKRAELNLVHQREVSNDELFKNLEQVWIKLGRQPVFRDIRNPNSRFSVHRFINMSSGLENGEKHLSNLFSTSILIGQRKKAASQKILL